ncbi:hypothetical protein [Herpetosiphon giganteus]|uniref:hypothetical protein n=1 Tax=Herpetosiphon giganteus TaxID=2029754 RepID=UPI0019576747|nr:hypothetical protein [Herpetosiphon giganteus]MBM7842800.1 hypothetical protein [Herpetosiphon giganteus]
MNNEQKNHDEPGFGEKAKDFIQNLFDRDETPNNAPVTQNAEEESNKPRDRGIVEYTKDFVSNMFGNDRAHERREDGEADTPHDRGFAEYTKDFAGGLVGRDRDENPNPTDAAAEKARNVAEAAQNAAQKAREQVDKQKNH